MIKMTYYFLIWWGEYDMNTYFMKGNEPWRRRVNRDGVVVMEARDPNNYMHGHSYFELGYVLDGTARHILNGNETIIKKGDFFLMDLESRHAYFGDENCFIVNLLFYPWILEPSLAHCRKLSELVSHFLIGYLPQNIGLVHVRIFHDDQTVLRLLESIAEELYFMRPGTQAMVRAYMIELMVEIMRLLGQEQQKRYSTITQDIIAVIEQKYAENITLAQIADRLGYSPAYLSRRFRADIGQSFMTYLQRYRLEAACHLLTTGEESVLRVARSVGYEDVRFFYEIFKRVYLCTPTQYRAKHKKFKLTRL